MIGAIRLVNPWRGTIWGSYGERLRVTTQDGERWEIHCSEDGHDFYPGRGFSRHEIEAWAANDPLFESELAVSEGLQEDDLLGEVPARDRDPRQWRWYAFSQGEVRLKGKAKPSAGELASACAEALAADAKESVPLIDRFELWGCDLETGEPLALLLTGNTELDARGTFSPKWRFVVPGIDNEDYWPEGATKAPTQDFEDRLNERLLKWTERGTVQHASRLFERINQQSVSELPLLNQPPLTSDPLALRQTILAEPWESEYQQLRRLWEAAREA